MITTFHPPHAEVCAMPGTILEPIVIEYDGQTYEVAVAAYRSPTGIVIEADLSELRRLLEELEA